jgi:hypothetical protein
MKIYQAVQKLLVGDIQTHTHTDIQTGVLISLLSFLESRLIITRDDLTGANSDLLYTTILSVIFIENKRE